MVGNFPNKWYPWSLDPRTIHRCLMNLVTNAIDACIFDPDVDKDHQVTVVTAMEDAGTVRFDVKDNGCGMSEEVRSKLFSSFFSTKGVKGTGLGLLVTAKLVEEHKGSIDVTSTEGEGPPSHPVSGARSSRTAAIRSAAARPCQITLQTNDRFSI
jgi:signal transduction histidine kinase